MTFAHPLGLAGMRPWFVCRVAPLSAEPVGAPLFPGGHGRQAPAGGGVGVQAPQRGALGAAAAVQPLPHLARGRARLVGGVATACQGACAIAADWAGPCSTSVLGPNEPSPLRVRVEIMGLIIIRSD
jgi:hypothetical protein